MERRLRGIPTGRIPLVDDWESALPLRLREEHPLWQRMLAFYRRAAEVLAGKLYLGTPDLHTNMDLLAALRGPQRLCEDLLDQPEMIDRAMDSARAIFPRVWESTARAGRMADRGYVGPVATLQCDFSCMISPAMFRRWVLPALEEEAALVGRAVYHWDGPGALVHTGDLLAAAGLHTLSYVPGDGNGSHLDHVELFQRVQAGGKAVQVWGSPEDMQALHRELRPEKNDVLHLMRQPARGGSPAGLVRAPHLKSDVPLGARTGYHMSRRTIMPALAG